MKGREREQKMGGEKDVEERQKKDKKSKTSERRQWQGGFLQTPLSSFPLEARSCKVTVGLQFWQTGGNYTYTHTNTRTATERETAAPWWLEPGCNKAMAGLNLQTKKPRAYRSASADSPSPVSGGCLSVQTHSCPRLCREKLAASLPKHTSPLRPVQFFTH